MVRPGAGSPRSAPLDLVPEIPELGGPTGGSFLCGFVSAGGDSERDTVAGFSARAWSPADVTGPGFDRGTAGRPIPDGTQWRLSRCASLSSWSPRIRYGPCRLARRNWLRCLIAASRSSFLPLRRYSPRQALPARNRLRVPVGLCFSAEWIATKDCTTFNHWSLVAPGSPESLWKVSTVAGNEGVTGLVLHRPGDALSPMSARTARVVRMTATGFMGAASILAVRRT
jgi:hypothetical protein